MPGRSGNLTDQSINNLLSIIMQSGDPVLIGGAAMRAHGVIRHVDDVDAYLHVQKPFTQMMPPRVDVTDSMYVYGRLNIGDIRKSPESGNPDIKGRAISLETLFILKAESGRDKDIADLSLLAKKISPESVMKRLGELRQYNNESLHAEFVETTFMELQLHFGVVDCELLEYSGLSEERIDDMASSLNRKHRMTI